MRIDRPTFTNFLLGVVISNVVSKNTVPVGVLGSNNIGTDRATDLGLILFQLGIGNRNLRDTVNGTAHISGLIVAE